MDEFENNVGNDGTDEKTAGEWMAHVRLLVQTSSSLTLSGSGQINREAASASLQLRARLMEHAAAHHHLPVAKGGKRQQACPVRASTTEHVRRIAIRADRKRAAARANLQRHFGRRALARFDDAATRGGVGMISEILLRYARWDVDRRCGLVNFLAK